MNFPSARDGGVGLCSSEPRSPVNKATTTRTTKYGGRGHALTEGPGGVEAGRQPRASAPALTWPPYGNPHRRQHVLSVPHCETRVTKLPTSPSSKLGCC